MGLSQLRRSCYRSLVGLLLATLVSRAQSPIHIDVDLAKPAGKFTPIYSWFGYDESGYTVTPNGKALLGQLHNLSPVPVYIRAHFLLATGMASPISNGVRRTSTPRMRRENPFIAGSFSTRFLMRTLPPMCAPWWNSALCPRRFPLIRSLPYRMAAQARRSGRLVVSSQRLQAMAGAESSSGRAHGPALWHGDGFHLVLGGVE